jgi:hypothetical protein
MTTAADDVMIGRLQAILVKECFDSAGIALNRLEVPFHFFQPSLTGLQSDLSQNFLTKEKVSAVRNKTEFLLCIANHSGRNACALLMVLW